MENDQIGRLRDIQEACRLVESYVASVKDTDFFTDTEKQDAVVRRIEIIGEATAHLSEATRAELPNLPFRKMRGMRNIVAHDYGHVDVALVWKAATVAIPAIRSALDEFFGGWDIQS
jgi:uncharacterized protein with HEPN domain